MDYTTLVQQLAPRVVDSMESTILTSWCSIVFIFTSKMDTVMAHHVITATFFAVCVSQGVFLVGKLTDILTLDYLVAMA